MNNTIFISIKDKPMKAIIFREKNYEFRTRIPNKVITTFFVYTSGETKILEYIMEVGNPIKCPNKILENGLGNKEFNALEKGYIYAWPILHLKKLKEPLLLSRLKNEFLFSPPQCFTYAKTNEKLYKYILKADKEIIF